MTLEQIIQKAIDGGWCPLPEMKSLDSIKHYPFNGVFGFWYANGNGVSKEYGAIFMDRFFWKGLAKSLDIKECENQKCCYGGLPKWEELWRDFIHHLALGKNIESFFKKYLYDQPKPRK